MTDASMIREYLEWRAGNEGLEVDVSPEAFALHNAVLNVMAVADLYLKDRAIQPELNDALLEYRHCLEALSASQ